MARLVFIVQQHKIRRDSKNMVQPGGSRSALRHTRVIATIGPASDSPEVIAGLIDAGMDIARLNLSHGTPDGHRDTACSIREIADGIGRDIGILADIPGPKLRIAAGSPETRMSYGDDLLLSGNPDIPGSLTLSPSSCIPEVCIGDTVLIGDGAVTLVIKAPGDPIIATVISGGVIRGGMGVVVPGRRPDILYAGPDLIGYITFAMTLNPDYIALSFVGSARDIRDARKILKEEGREDTLIIAKIESGQAVRNLDEILQEADGIMVARGDLGVELPIEQVPELQKRIITRCNQMGLPVITATEMLESMVHRGVPTRAEVTDVANAIFDGTDATMLSAETSIGVNPIHAVRMMTRIAAEAEQHLPYVKILNERAGWHEKNVEGIISYRACYIGEELESPAIVAFTRSGLTAERVSRCRPRAPIVAITPESRVARRLLLRWGVLPVIADPIHTADELFSASVQIVKELGLSSSGDQLVIIAGNFAGDTGRTNMIKVLEVT